MLVMIQQMAAAGHSVAARNFLQGRRPIHQHCKSYMMLRKGLKHAQVHQRNFLNDIVVSESLVGMHCLF